MDDIKEWTSLPVPNLLTMASDRKRLGEKICAESSNTPPDHLIGQGTELNRDIIEPTTVSL